MLNLDDIVSNKKENKDHNWLFGMLIIGPSGSGKTNTVLHLINKREQAGIKNLNDPHAFIEYSSV